MTIPQNTHLAHKDLQCMKIFKYTLITYVYYIQWFTFYESYYLDVTAFPPEKNLVPRFGSRR
jgi:hypothetical protein